MWMVGLIRLMLGRGLQRRIYSGSGDQLCSHLSVPDLSLRGRELSLLDE